MKHKTSVTIAIIIVFFIAQIAGLITASHNSKVVQTEEGLTVEVKDTAVGQRPQISQQTLVISIIIGILIGTGVILLISKFKKPMVWKAWYGFAVFYSSLIALGSYINAFLASIFALFLTIMKFSSTNPFILNSIEILVYVGISIIFAPLLSPFWAMILLLIISAYDYVAVFKSKHMVKLAEFQKKSGVFSGVKIDYKIKTVHHSAETKEGQKETESHPSYALANRNAGKLETQAKQNKRRAQEENKNRRTALLGGGDIAFPMIYNISIFYFVLSISASKQKALLAGSWVAVAETIALFLLFLTAKKDKYYPAMPPLTIGAILGSISLFILI